MRIVKQRLLEMIPDLQVGYLHGTLAVSRAPQKTRPHPATRARLFSLAWQVFLDIDDLEEGACPPDPLRVARSA